MSRTKEDIANIYTSLKAKAGGEPLRYREFLKQSGIPAKEIERHFGSSPYSKLQKLAGDTPNRLDLEATPIRQIMSDYGQLASDVIQAEDRLPVAAEWAQKDLRPTESGLNKAHGIRWSEFPDKFMKFCSDNKEFASGFEDVLQFIRGREVNEPRERVDAVDILLADVADEIAAWSPAIRRNSEEAYKSELSLHLRGTSPIKRAGLAVREERGDSQCDIALDFKIGLELKKAPTQSDYDRCFGQVARHLESFDRVIVVICDSPSRDRFEDFNRLIDRYFGYRVRVIRNG